MPSPGITAMSWMTSSMAAHPFASRPRAASTPPCTAPRRRGSSTAEPPPPPPGVSTVVSGARADGQLADNLAAVDRQLSDDERARLDEVSAPPLIYPHW